MARKGENIYKRKDGRWEGRYKCGYTVAGKTKYKSVYAASYNECRQKLNEAKNNYDVGKEIVKIHMTAKEIFYKWLGVISINTKESSFNTYSAVVNNHILPVIGDIPIYKVTADILNDLVRDKLRSGRLDGKGGLAAVTVKNIVCVIKTVFRYSERVYGMRNPAEFIAAPKVVKKELEVLSDDEMAKIREHCTQNPDYFSLIYDICLSTGIRIGEVCALKCSDIDFEENILTVNKTVQRVKNTDSAVGRKTKVVISSPKTNKSERKIPLSQKLIEKIKEFIDVSQKSGGDFIFSVKENRPIDVRTVQNKFTVILKNCGIRKMKFHILRHTFATKWVNSNFDVKSLSEILGHSTVNITLSLYVHPSIEDKRKIMDKMCVA
ncbi:MAG: site-specific integrase [Firmicutes bacterium]|nr:site-specific integrase [Bacillota bacterium]